MENGRQSKGVLDDEGNEWTYGTAPSEVDKLIVIQSITYPVTGDGYQDDINNEDYGREESGWQDDCEADDRSEPRSTIAFGPIHLEVTPSPEKGEKGNYKAYKGEATSDGVEDKGSAQRL